MTDHAAETGHDRKYCGATKKQTEGWCHRPAGWGTDHPLIGRCKLHGGSTPPHRQSAVAVRVETEARTLFGKIVETSRVDNPLAVYAEFAGHVMSWMAVLSKLIHDVDAPRYAGMTGEQIRGEVVLYERALDRCNTVLSTYAKLNIDERLSRITEAQQYMVVQAIEAALAAAGVTGQLAVDAKKAAARRLRVVEAA